MNKRDDFDDPSSNEEPPRPGYDLSLTEIQECNKVYNMLTTAKKSDRNALLSQLIDAYKQADLYKFLQFNMELTLDELKVYYLFLREYFAPKTNHRVFESKKLLVRHLRKCILDIRKTRNSWRGYEKAREVHYIGDDNQWYSGSIKPTIPRAYDKKFLSTNENHLHSLLSNLEEKGIIKRLPRQLEMRHYKDQFPELATKKATWKLNTFQPAENEYESVTEGAILRSKVDVSVFATTPQERIRIISNMLHAEGDERFL